MKILFKLGGILIGIIALPFIIALFLPTKYTVEQRISINKSLDNVYTYVKYLNNQKNYSKWAMVDSTMEITVEGIDGEVGYTSRWKSTKKNIGEGEQKIINIKPLKQIDYAIYSKAPFKSKSKASITFKPLDNKTTEIMWGVYGEAPYPSNILLPLLGIKQNTSDDLALGLNNLKHILEKK